MATGKALNGKPYAGNPHVRFDEGEVASAATPRRGSLLYTMKATVKTLAAIVAMVATSATLPACADAVTADTALEAAKGWVNLRQSMDGEVFSAPESAKAA